MAPTLAANLDRLWRGRPLGERFRLAAERGFRRAEYLFPGPTDHEVIDRALRETGVRLALFDLAPGDLRAGERGLLALSGRESDFRAAAATDLALARRWRVPHVNALAGRLDADADVNRALDTAAANLAALAPAAEGLGVTLLVEFINRHDEPGYALRSPEAAASLVRSLDHPAVRLQFDQYHIERAGQDPVVAFDEVADVVGYVQIAEAPARHEPSDPTGGARRLLRHLAERDVDLTVGLEYDPSSSTEEALAWLDDVDWL